MVLSGNDFSAICTHIMQKSTTAKEVTKRLVELKGFIFSAILVGWLVVLG